MLLLKNETLFIGGIVNVLVCIFSILASILFALFCESFQNTNVSISNNFKKDKILVMVIDTGIGKHYLLDDIVDYDNTTNYIDEDGHGTHVAGIIAYGNNGDFTDKVCDRVRIISCKAFSVNDPLKAAIQCIQLASQMGVEYINYSGGGVYRDKEEKLAYEGFIARGGQVIVAAGNDNTNISKYAYYPASYVYSNNLKLQVVGSS